MNVLASLGMLRVSDAGIPEPRAASVEFELLHSLLSELQAPGEKGHTLGRLVPSNLLFSLHSPPWGRTVPFYRGGKLRPKVILRQSFETRPWLHGAHQGSVAPEDPPLYPCSPLKCSEGRGMSPHRRCARSSSFLGTRHKECHRRAQGLQPLWLLDMPLPAPSSLSPPEPLRAQEELRCAWLHSMAEPRLG